MSALRTLQTLARESARAAAESIAGQGLRSALTVVGIAVGVASVVAVVALVDALERSVTAEFEGLGGNSLSIASFTPLEERARGRIASLTPDDLARIAVRIDGIASITPLLYSPLEPLVEVRHGSEVALVPLRGTTHTYQDVYRAYPAVGRFLSVADDRHRRRVCVVGDKTLADLGLPGDPVGEYIEVGGEWLKVVGATERKGDFLGMSQDDYVLVPYGTMAALLGDMPTDMVIQLALDDGVDRDHAQERIAQVLRRAHGLTPDAEDDFRIQSPDQLADAFAEIGAVVTAVAAGAVGVSLLVGGIGIMNIMLVSVTERTREIGIQKALGATRVHILAQFLTEALALALLGGLLGLSLGYGFGALLGVLLPGFEDVTVPLWAVAVSLSFSGGVGVAFGILPALRAADLHPVDALRFE